MTIHDEVVAGVAALAALDTDGIVGMASGGGFGDLLRRDALWRGIRVQEGGNQGLRIDAYVVAAYGVHLPEVARQAARNITQAMEEAVGVHPSRVTVHVAGIRIP